MDTQEIWPEHCGSDYRSQLAPPKDWNVAVTICQMRAGCDIGGMGRAVLADMPLRASRIGGEGGVASGSTEDMGKSPAGEKTAYTGELEILG